MKKILGEYHIDHLYELYVKAWMVYHQTAHEIDGHIENPVTAAEWATTVRAMRTAVKAQTDFLLANCMIRPTSQERTTYKKWNAAKQEALRRLGL